MIFIIIINLFAFAILSAARPMDTVKFGNAVISSNSPAEFKFKQEDADDRQIRLIFKARIDWKDLGGYAPVMRVTVNGAPINGARLLNKPLKFRTRTGGVGSWTSLDGDANWFIMYSPDFSDRIKNDENYKYGLYEKEQEPYRFVLDLTGMTQHINMNTVRFTSSLKIVLEDIEVQTGGNVMPRINLPPKPKTAPTGPLQDKTLKTYAANKITLKDDNSVVDADGRKYLISSTFSIPGGEFAAINGNLLDTPQYTVKREIKIDNGRVRFFDTYTNKLDKVTGVIVRNKITLPAKADKFLYGGGINMLKETGVGTNATLFAQIGKDCAVLVPEDDIFRNQGRFAGKDDTMTLLDRNLGLPPKGSHTLEWSFYILKDCDYFGMINRVRNDWDSNFKLEGPFSFPYGGGCNNLSWFYWDNKNPIPRPVVNEWLTQRPVKMVITHVPGNYLTKKSDNMNMLGHGSALTHPHYTWWRDSTRNMNEAFKKFAPDVKVYSYLHKNLCSEPGAKEKYADSLALDGTSKALSKGISVRMLPTRNNSYGKALKETYKYMVENLGTHIYMDEINLSVTAWEKYPEWDNATVIIDPATHTVKNTISIPNLLVKGVLDDMCAYLKSKNRILIANGAPVLRSLHQNKSIHFVEQGMGIGGLYSMHLSTPVGFCYHHGAKGFSHFVEALDAGVVCFLYSGDWSLHSFPLTPIQLGQGFIIGRERILTKESGIFGWNDNSECVIYAYDSKGERIDSSKYVNVRKADGKISYEVRIPGDFLVIIVKKDQPDTKLQYQKAAAPSNGVFDKWTIVDAKLRARMAAYADEDKSVLHLKAPDKSYGFFCQTPYDVDYGKIIRMTGKIKGTGSFRVGILGYKDKGYSSTMFTDSAVKLADSMQDFTAEFHIGRNDTKAVRPIFNISKGSAVDVTAFKIEILDAKGTVKTPAEVKKGIFDSWTILDAKMRKDEKNLVKKDGANIILTSKGKAYNIFATKGYDAPRNCKIRMTGKISGKGTLNVGVFGYADSGYKNTMFTGKNLTAFAENNDFEVIFHIGRADTNYLRPTLRINKNSEIKISEFKVSIED